VKIGDDAKPLPREILFERSVYGDSADAGLIEHRRGTPIFAASFTGISTAPERIFGRQTLCDRFTRLHVCRRRSGSPSPNNELCAQVGRPHRNAVLHYVIASTRPYQILAPYTVHRSHRVANLRLALRAIPKLLSCLRHARTCGLRCWDRACRIS